MIVIKKNNGHFQKNPAFKNKHIILCINIHDNSGEMKKQILIIININIQR